MVIKQFHSHVEKLRPLCERWLNESRASQFGMKPDVKELLFHAMCIGVNDDSAIFTMESKEGKVLGVLGVVVSKNMLQNSNILNEHVWYVLPEHRNRYSFEMINRAEQWGVERGCKHFMVTASRLISPVHDKMCRVYNGLGFSHFETSFIKEI